MQVKVNETELSKQNNNAFGYERFDYLYPEDSFPWKRDSTDTWEICKFLRRHNCAYKQIRNHLVDYCLFYGAYLLSRFALL